MPLAAITDAGKTGWPRADFEIEEISRELAKNGAIDDLRLMGFEATTPRAEGVVFDLGDTLVEYEGLPLSWEAYYVDALSGLAKDLGTALTPPGLACACSVLRGYNTRLFRRTEEVYFKEP